MEDAQGPEKGTGSSTRMSEKPQTSDYAKSLVQMIMSETEAACLRKNQGLFQNLFGTS